MTPTQDINVLGFTINSISTEIKLPGRGRGDGDSNREKESLRKGTPPPPPPPQDIQLSRILGKQVRHPVLQEPAELLPNSWRRVIKSILPPVSNSRCEGRTAGGKCHKNGYVNNRLGHHMPGHQDRRPKVKKRAADAHKLPRTASSISSSQMLFQRQTEPNDHLRPDSTTNYSCQQAGWHYGSRTQTVTK